MNAHPEDILAPKAALKVADGDGFTVHGSQHKKNRNGEIRKVCRSLSHSECYGKVVACIKRSTKELGRPFNLPMVDVRYTVTEAHKGKPGNRPIPEPNQRQDLGKPNRPKGGRLKD